MFRVVRLEGAQIILATDDGSSTTVVSSTRSGSAKRGRSQQRRQRGRQPGQPTAKAKGTKPSGGTGADAILSIVGVWNGSKGETYSVHDTWVCDREDSKGKLTYDLGWVCDREDSK